MKVNFTQVVEQLEKWATKERLDAVKSFLDQHGDDIAKGIDKASAYVQKHTPVLCEMIEVKELDMDALKEILTKTRTPESDFAALLDMGRNAQDELELFLQYLDANKKAVDKNKVYCIRCGMKSNELKELFGDKSMLLLKL